MTDYNKLALIARNLMTGDELYIDGYYGVHVSTNGSRLAASVGDGDGYMPAMRLQYYLTEGFGETTPEILRQRIPRAINSLEVGNVNPEQVNVYLPPNILFETPRYILGDLLYTFGSEGILSPETHGLIKCTRPDTDTYQYCYCILQYDGAWKVSACYITLEEFHKSGITYTPNWYKEFPVIPE